MKALEIRGLRKSYGDFPALRGIDIDVFEGEIFALLGPNGAGKTTLIRILAEGARYDSGEVRVFGEPLSKRTTRLIGYVPQESIAYCTLAVEENLRFYAGLYDAPVERIPGLIEEFELPPARKAGELSGGQKRKLNLAVALLYEPRILILDEPSNGLDVPARRELWRRIRGLRDEGKTVLLASHYMEEVEALADRVAVMHEGSIAAVGTVEGLKRMAGKESVIHIEGILRGTDGLGGLSMGEKNGALRVRTENPGKDLPRIIEVLIRAGSEIRLLRVEEPTLEDVFVKLTGRELE